MARQHGIIPLVPRETTLRPAPWLYAVLAAGDLGATGSAVLMYLEQGLSLVTIGLAGLSIGFSVRFAGFAASRIDLLPDELRVTGILGRRSVAKPDVTSAQVDGSVVFLQLQNGQRFKLPSAGYHSAGVVDSVRDWIGDRAP